MRLVRLHNASIQPSYRERSLGRLVLVIVYHLPEGRSLMSSVSVKTIYFKEYVQQVVTSIQLDSGMCQGCFKDDMWGLQVLGISLR